MSPRPPRVLAALIAALVFAAHAGPAAAVYAEVLTYAHGYLAPTQGFASHTDDATLAGWCTAVYGAEIDKPQAYFGTAALIAPDGSWRASNRGTASAVSVSVTPPTLAAARAYRKKAYAKNSDPSRVYAATARLGRFVSNNPGCPIPVR